jgi:hypothetical protein
MPAKKNSSPRSSYEIDRLVREVDRLINEEQYSVNRACQEMRIQPTVYYYRKRREKVEEALESLPDNHVPYFKPKVEAVVSKNNNKKAPPKKKDITSIVAELESAVAEKAEAEVVLQQCELRVKLLKRELLNVLNEGGV